MTENITGFLILMAIFIGVPALGTTWALGWGTDKKDKVREKQVKQECKFIEYKHLEDLRRVYHRSINKEIWGDPKRPKSESCFGSGLPSTAHYE
jgi:hypothetical protein